MAYIGTSPANGVRRKHTYTATAGQTSFSGADDNNVTLTYVDTEYLDVYQNGVKLVAVSDYASTTGTSVVLVQGASVDDTVEIIVFDVFSVADTVSAGSGGSFGGNIGIGGTLAVTGETTLATHLNLGDSDRIKLGAGSDLQLYHDGTDSYITNATNSLKVDSNAGLSLKIDGFGHVTKPLQPAFSAYLSGTQSNIAVGSDVTISFAAERFDQNADFNTSNYTFTAPETGKYLLSVSVQLSNSLDSAANYYQAKLVTSNKTYEDVLDPDFGQDNLYFPLEFSVLADMDADDTAIVKIAQTAGSQQTNVDSQSHFTGFLAC